MKKIIKRILKPLFIFIVTVFVIYAVVTNISFFQNLMQKNTLIILVDTDAGYGTDDIFAVSRILMDPDIQVIGLLSSQWHYADLKNDSTLFMSHDINYKLARVFNRDFIPRQLGGQQPIRFAEKPLSNSNRAAKFIADRAMEVVSGEKLNILCLGPSTNLAAAVTIQPEAASRIRCYMMGPYYEPSRRIWNKNEFNARNDLDAIDTLFNTEDLELHVMPANIAVEMIFTKSEAIEPLQGSDAVSEFIQAEYTQSFFNTDSVTFSSIALIEALLNPDLVTEKQVFTPPENTQRKVSVFTRIHADKMKQDYWRSLERYLEAN